MKALLVLLVGCANDPALGAATWNEMPAGESTLFKQAFVTRIGEIAVRFFDDDSEIHCSELRVEPQPAPTESRITFSVPAIQTTGQVEITAPLDLATSTATIYMSGRVYFSGTVTITDAGDRLAGTFSAAGKTADGDLASIEGMFDAPYCD